VFFSVRGAPGSVHLSPLDACSFLLVLIYRNWGLVGGWVPFRTCRICIFRTLLSVGVFYSRYMQIRGPLQALQAWPTWPSWGSLMNTPPPPSPNFLHKYTVNGQWWASSRIVQTYAYCSSLDLWLIYMWIFQTHAEYSSLNLLLIYEHQFEVHFWLSKRSYIVVCFPR